MREIATRNVHLSQSSAFCTNGWGVWGLWSDWDGLIVVHHTALCALRIAMSPSFPLKHFPREDRYGSFGYLARIEQIAPTDPAGWSRVEFQIVTARGCGS
jgi:hypothetical protein